MLISQKRHGEIFSYYRILISRIRCNYWQSLLKILYMGFRATLHFRKFKVALNPVQPLFCSLNALFSDVPVAVADVAVFVNYLYYAACARASHIFSFCLSPVAFSFTRKYVRLQNWRGRARNAIVTSSAGFLFKSPPSLKGTVSV